MSNDPKQTSMHGAICYLEIPAVDPKRSAQFYHDVFGWSIRHHHDGSLAFDDNTATSRQVSGTWVTGRPPLDTIGIVISIMVDDAEETVRKIVQYGGEIVRPLGFNPQERIAWFRDPGGNILGIYQEP
ncbi:MAG TPA: VOC family protein [Patescibacteria group bacterium]|nr:VOC family protein [Patescibacteria group bacterium]